MKLKINKARDLSSISVLPPQSRRSSALTSGLESSTFGRSQTMSQLRPQQPQLSQPSLSQGVSSQQGLFSQFSQNSQDEAFLYEKNGSQERENSVRRASCLPRISYTRDESQIIGSKSSNNLMRKLTAPEYKCQINEELERRVVMIETSVSRLGMILDSVQNDIMQVNKCTKEVALEVQDVRQKLVVHDDTLQTMFKGQEDLKMRIAIGMKSLLDQMNININQGKFGALVPMLSALSEKIDTQMMKLQCDLSKDFGKQVQAIACSMKISKQQQTDSPIESHKAASSLLPPMEVQLPKNCSISMEPKICQKHPPPPPRVETGGWTLVKQDGMASKVGNSNLRHSQILLSPPKLECKIVIDSDEDIDEGFSFLLEEQGTETNDYSMEDAKDETARILKKARRRKRKHCNTIVID